MNNLRSRLARAERRIREAEREHFAEFREVLERLSYQQLLLLRARARWYDALKLNREQFLALRREITRLHVLEVPAVEIPQRISAMLTNWGIPHDIQDFINPPELARSGE